MSLFGIIGNGIILPIIGDGMSFTHLARETVTGSAVTSVTFSSLTLANRACFFITGRLKNAGNASAILCFLNGNNTTSDYRSQYMLASGSTVSSARTSNSNITNLDAFDDAFFTIYVAYADNQGMALCEAMNGFNTSNIVQEATRVFDNTNSYSNITSIQISSSVASNIDVGSVFDLFALEADA